MLGVNLHITGHHLFQSKFRICHSTVKTKTKLHGQNPRANYTGRETSSCRRSYCQLIADRGCHVVSVTDPYGRILGFIDRSRYFSLK
jgi:hypothetical protein